MLITVVFLLYFQETFIHQENIELYKKLNLISNENEELQKKVLSTH